MADLPHLPLPKLSTQDVPYSRPSTPGEHPQSLQIGWVGLGGMGSRMARNLARYHAKHPRHSLPLLVWNRTIGKAHDLVKELGADKASVAQSLAEIATTCDVIICSLANDDVVKRVYHQFAEVLKEHPPAKDKTFVETSTIYPTVAGELDSIISAIPHCHLVTSPVFGPPAMADTAKLIIAMSGNYGCKKQVAYLLVPAIGRRVLDLGGNLEKAPTFKLIGNSLVLGVLELLAEAFTLAEKTGVGEQLVQEYVKELMPAPLMIAYGEKMLHDAFDGSKGFGINGGIKDAAHMRRLAQDANAPLPTVDIAHGHLLTARALHEVHVAAGTTQFPVLDWSAIVAGTRVAAGLDGLNSRKHPGVVREDEHEDEDEDEK